MFVRAAAAISMALALQTPAFRAATRLVVLLADKPRIEHEGAGRKGARIGFGVFSFWVVLGKAARYAVVAWTIRQF